MRLVKTDHILEKNQDLIDQVLHAAASHFAEKGLAGARVGDIARDAGVNKATMYYHIGNKEALYRTVLTEPLRVIFETVTRETENATSPTEKIRSYVFAYAEAMGGKYQYFPSLMMNELNYGAVNLPKQGLQYLCDTVGVLDSILTDGRTQGLFREVETFTVHMLIVGSLAVHATGEPLRRRMLELHSELSTKMHSVSMNEVAEQVADMILQSVKKNG